MTDFYEKPEISEGWINGGYFVLNAAALDYIDGDDTPGSASRWNGSPRRPAHGLSPQRLLVLHGHAQGKAISRRTLGAGRTMEDLGRQAGL